MTLINLKFSPEMEELVLQGKKCCTTRDEKKGEVGDVFRIRDRIYRIIDIVATRIDGGALSYFSMDGFDDMDEYLKTIRSLYPDKNIVFIHTFAYMDNACDDFGYSGQCIAKETCKVGEWCSKKKMVYL